MAATAPNPAGLIGTLVVKFRDGHTLTVPTDKNWQTAQAVQGKWTTEATAAGDWSAAMELGAMGMGPWGPSRRRPRSLRCTAISASSRLCWVNWVSPPDFESDGPLRYTHRRDGEADIYFVANREDRAVEANCTFRVSGKTPELWDPLTGEMRALPEFAARDGRTTVPMRFEAGAVVLRRVPKSRARLHGGS